jgi:hypothetical protein
MADYRWFCISYALALRLLTGYPMYYVGSGHAVVKSPDGWLDEAGVRSIEEIAEDWNISTELYELGTGDYAQLAKYLNLPGWEETVTAARAQVENL